MKKSMIKIIATVLSVMMLIPCISMVISVSAISSPLEKMFAYGDFRFDDNGDGTCTVWQYLGDDINLTIPTYAYNYDNEKLLVTTIRYSAFENNTEIKSVAIPLSVTTIESDAFSGCTSLVTVSVSKVTTIEWKAFANCTSLRKIVIPETVEEIGAGAYEGDEKLEGVNIVNTDLNIAEDAFEGCDILTIYGYKNSTAEEFAENNGYDFESIDSKDIYEDMNPNHWWYNAINFVTAYDLLPGMVENGADVFNPTDNMTRADAMNMLWAFEGKPVGFDSGFTDVPTLYENPIGWAKEKEITSGISETEFGSTNTISKVQLITFLYRYAQYKNYDTNLDNYSIPSTMTDFNSVPSYAQNAVKWAAKNNIITTDGAFSPNANATRAIAATVIYMFMSNVDC